MSKAGTLISIEGVHGAGKTTLRSLLERELRSRGFEVVELVDQAGTAVGRELRKITLESNVFPLAPLTEALLIAAARHQNVVEIIEPNLEQGRIVITERFNDAYIAFQGFGRGLSSELLEHIASFVSKGIVPELTLFLDIEPQIALARIDSEMRHRIEREPPGFHSKVREGYLSQAVKYPSRIRVIDASNPTSVVFNSAWKEVARVLGLDK